MHRVALAVIALVLAGCSAADASEKERLEDALRELAEAGAHQRSPASEVDSVVCEPLELPSYSCTVTWANLDLFPFCAELRNGTAYMASTKEGCTASSRGQRYTRATPDAFT